MACRSNSICQKRSVLPGSLPNQGTGNLDQVMLTTPPSLRRSRSKSHPKGQGVSRSGGTGRTKYPLTPSHPHQAKCQRLLLSANTRFGSDVWERRQGHRTRQCRHPAHNSRQPKRFRKVRLQLMGKLPRQTLSALRKLCLPSNIGAGRTLLPVHPASVTATVPKPGLKVVTSMRRCLLPTLHVHILHSNLPSGCYFDDTP